MSHIKMTDMVEYLSSKDPVERAFLGLKLKLQITSFFGVGLDTAEKYLTQADQAYRYGVYYLWSDFYSTLTSEESLLVNIITGTQNSTRESFSINLESPLNATTYYVENRGKYRSNYKLENAIKFTPGNGKLDFTPKPESPVDYTAHPKKNINIEFTTLNTGVSPGIKTIANNILRFHKFDKIKGLNITKKEILEVMFGNADVVAKKYGIETWQYIDMLSRIFLELIDETEGRPFILDTAVSTEFRDTKLYLHLAYSIDDFKLLLQSLTDDLIKLKEVGDFQVSVKKWLEGLFELFIDVPGVIFFEQMYPEFIDWDKYQELRSVGDI